MRDEHARGVNRESLPPEGLRIARRRCVESTPNYPFGTCIGGLRNDSNQVSRDQREENVFLHDFIYCFRNTQRTFQNSPTRAIGRRQNALSPESCSQLRGDSTSYSRHRAILPSTIFTITKPWVRAVDIREARDHKIL